MTAYPDRDLTRPPVTIQLDGSTQGVVLLHGNGEVTIIQDSEVARITDSTFGSYALDSPIVRAVTVARLRALADHLQGVSPCTAVA